MVVLKTSHTIKFLGFQTHHQRSAFLDVQGVVDFSGKEICYCAVFLYKPAVFYYLSFFYAFTRESPAPFPLLDSPFLNTVDHPSYTVIVRQVVLSRFLHRCHEPPTIARVACLFIKVEGIPAIATLFFQF